MREAGPWSKEGRCNGELIKLCTLLLVQCHDPPPFTSYTVLFEIAADTDGSR
ncbi:hypothetical protein SLEP1_g2516 [Rubroshorea leprosula]|uniref:Uncharacterized protein n=1 Tax=Rubroshorea leprosula TaxID=152421 RepID=A0AAV5HLU1_9ROSI|nr:hypothetical protein SLEP1_g2516 [Rubroshorea leprosula]